MASRDLIVGLDLGTTKVTTVIVEIGEEGGAQIVGVGFCPAQGMKRGVVVNIEKTVEAITRSVEEAERMAGVKVTSIYAGIAGDHIRSLNSKGVIAVTRSSQRDRTGIITRHDVDRVIEAAKAVNLPLDREVLHVLPQSYTVDEQGGIDDPVGMSGVRLEADVHIITGAVASAQNIYRCVKQAGFNVQDLVLEPLASSYSVLTVDERDMGVALMDLGGGTSDVAVFNEHSIRHTSVIGMGGENVTRDLAIGLRTPFEQAERIKREYGHCFPKEINVKEEVDIPNIGGQGSRTVERGYITEIIRLRMQEIFECAIAELKKAGAWDLIYSGGIVLTGGASLVEGTKELAEEMFDLPVKIGYPSGLGGLMASARSPIYSTAVGLVLYGMQQEVRGETLRGDDSTIFRNIFGRMKEWFVDFF